MKIPSLKIIFLFALIFSINLGANAQETPEYAEEIQPLMLIDNKITFYAEQMTPSSVKVKHKDKTLESSELPKLTISPDQKIITIDFSNCESGNYIIIGTRGDLELQYLIECKN